MDFTRLYTIVMAAQFFGFTTILSACDAGEDDDDDQVGDDDDSLSDDDDVSDDDGAGDDDTTPDDYWLCFEDFEGDPDDLEHFYNTQYYTNWEEWEEASDSDMHGEGLIMSTDEHSVAAGNAWYSYEYLEDWEHTMSTGFSSYDSFGYIDLIDCTTGFVTFTWGIDDHTMSYLRRDIVADIEYNGMGEDDSVSCTGVMSVDHNNVSGSDDFDLGPWTVTCPVGYDCGYEEEGTFSLGLDLELRCESDDGCEGARLGVFVWIDDVGVHLE